MRVHFNGVVVDIRRSDIASCNSTIEALCAMEPTKAVETIVAYREKLEANHNKITIKQFTRKWPTDPFEDNDLTNFHANVLHLLWIAMTTVDIFGCCGAHAIGCWNTYIEMPPGMVALTDEEVAALPPVTVSNPHAR